MGDRICNVPDCDSFVGLKSARGMCPLHYKRWMKHGTTDLPPVTNRGCAVEGCDRKHHALGMCQLHHKRWWTNGSLEPIIRFPPAPERLAAGLVERPSGCIEWTGLLHPAGYGRLWVNGKLTYTHRFAWELVNGPIPAGMLIRHLVCDNPPCCNVAHLALGTDADNMADKIAKGRQGIHPQRTKTHCKHGHLFDEANTYVDKHGYRSCRTCSRAADIRSYNRRRSTP